MDNFVDYKIAEINLHPEMSFVDLQQLVVHKIESVVNIDNIETFACIRSKDFMKKDLMLKKDNDVRSFFHLISRGIEEYCTLIIHSTSNPSLVIHNRYPIKHSSGSRDEEGRFYETIDLAKITPNLQVKIDDMFSSKDVLNAMQDIAIKDNIQYQIVKSNKEVLVLSYLIDECQWSFRACSIANDDNSTWIITRFDHELSCSLDIVLSGHIQITFHIIKECIKKKISIDGSQLSTLKDIVHYNSY